jgi:hypothetical protein
MDSKVRKRLFWAIVFSIGFMVILLSRIEWQHFSLIAVRLDIKSLISACSMFTAGNLVRAFRFRKFDHMDKKLVHWWNINAFYNVVTATLPGGAGEAASAYVLKRYSQFNLLSAVRILILSRVMDLFALSLLFFIATLRISSFTPYREAAAWLSGALFLISSFALLRSTEQLVLKLMHRLPGQGIFKQRVCAKLTELLVISDEQRKKNTFGITLMMSFLMMIMGVITVHLLLRSLGVYFTPLQSVYCYGVYMIFQIVPVHGIAGIGTQAAWWALALKSSGYSAPDAVALGFVLHGSFYVFIFLIALSALMVWLIQRKK